VIDRPYGLWVATCNWQLPAARNPESTVHVFFQLPVPGFKGHPVCAGQPELLSLQSPKQSFAWTATITLHSHSHSLSAWASWTMGTVAPHNYQRPQSDSQKTQKHRTRPTLERCDAVRWAFDGPPASHLYPAPQGHGLQNPAGWDQQPTNSPAHQDLLRTHSSRELPLSTLPLPYPSLKASQRCARGLHRGPNAVKVVVVLYCTVGQGWCVPAGSTDSESCTFKKGDGGSTSQLVSRLHVSDHFWEARCLFKLPR
jgi:hypothetical protein